MNNNIEISNDFANEGESSIDFESDNMNPLTGMNSNPLAN
jgi:hypothetical protein